MTVLIEDHLDELLDRAMAAASAASDLLMDRPTDLGIESKSTPTDAVTIMDKRSEQLLVAQLLDGRETDGVLGEEGAEGAGTAGVRWGSDPIVGPVRFLDGLPGWSVCVGLEYEGEAILGVVAVPTHGVTYFAARGRGAFQHTNGSISALTPSSVEELSFALTGTGFGYASSRRAGQARVLVHLLPELRDIRRTGSAAVDICWVAAGQLDAYFEKGLNPWDFTAASVIAAEAGVKLEGLRGIAPNEDLTLAANPVLFSKLHDRLVELQADLEDPPV